ncbi:MAG: hypothetical protein U5K56_12655 [Halioglobus sp.]|nr:hypothetical protein [Halioglobus sp.]
MRNHHHLELEMRRRHDPGVMHRLTLCFIRLWGRARHERADRACSAALLLREEATPTKP